MFAAENDGGDGHVTGSGLLSLKVGDVVSATHISSVGSVDAGNESTFTGFFCEIDPPLPHTHKTTTDDEKNSILVMMGI